MQHGYCNMTRTSVARIRSVVRHDFSTSQSNSVIMDGCNKQSVPKPCPFTSHRMHRVSKQQQRHNGMRCAHSLFVLKKHHSLLMWSFSFCPSITTKLALILQGTNVCGSSKRTHTHTHLGKKLRTVFLSASYGDVRRGTGDVDEDVKQCDRSIIPIVPFAWMVHGGLPPFLVCGFCLLFSFCRSHHHAKRKMQ